MIEHQTQKELPPWTEDVWDRWFYSFLKDIAASEGEGLDGSLEVSPATGKEGLAQ